MSLEIKGQSCPICHAYLFEEDEIAVCPVCAAPHHRECFISAGKCGMEELHGTENQYDLAKKRAVEETEEKVKGEENVQVAIECPSCHKSFDVNNRFCPYCGMENRYGRPIVIGVDYFGGVDKNEDLGEGFTANEVKNFVQIGTQRALPKFAAFKKGARVGFSLWSLMFPTAKFAARKMYREAVFTGIIEIAAVLLLLPLSILIEEMGFKNYGELINLVMEGNSQLIAPFIFASVGSVLYAGIRILSALFGYKLYYKHTLKKMKEINETALSDEEKTELYRKKGGVSLVGFLIAFLAIQWLPSIIISLIM